MTDAVPSDDALLAAARAGERPAIEGAAGEISGPMFGFGLRMCGDSEDAKDVLQDTLLAAARTIGDFRGGSSVSTWLYTIARSFCIEAAPARTSRARRRGLSRRHGAGLPSLDAWAGRARVAREVRRALPGRLESLDPASRAWS